MMGHQIIETEDYFPTNAYYQLYEYAPKIPLKNLAFINIIWIAHPFNSLNKLYQTFYDYFEYSGLKFQLYLLRYMIFITVQLD